MSYSFKIQADNKTDAKAQVAAKLENLKATQGVDHTLGVNVANQVIDLLHSDPSLGVDIEVRGSSKVAQGKTSHAEVHVTADAVRVAQQEPLADFPKRSSSASATSNTDGRPDFGFKEGTSGQDHRPAKPITPEDVAGRPDVATSLSGRPDPNPEAQKI
jgi:hypothetical protein